MLSPQLEVEARSEIKRSRSMSAQISVSSSWKRSDSASISPFSAIIACPSQARSVVDSPLPAAVYR